VVQRLRKIATDGARHGKAKIARELDDYRPDPFLPSLSRWASADSRPKTIPVQKCPSAGTA
jgi:hypothetical protein